MGARRSRGHATVDGGVIVGNGCLWRLTEGDAAALRSEPSHMILYHRNR